MKKTNLVKRVCGAKTRSGRPCQKAPVAGRNRCRLHGGATPIGKESVHYKTGRHSRHLPERLIARYQEAISDTKMLDLRDEVALVDSRTQELVAALDPDSEAYGGHWKEILNLLEQRRKLVESERKRLVEMNQMISAEQAMLLMSAIVGVIRENVQDRETMTRISDGIRGLVGE